MFLANGLRHKATASLIGTVLFIVVLMAAIGAQIYISSLQSEANQINQQVQNTINQRGKEGAQYTISGSGLSLQSSGQSQIKVVKGLVRWANGTVKEFVPLSSIVDSGTPANMESGILPSTLLSSYRAMAGSGDAADKIGILTNKGNVFWFSPAASAPSAQQMSLSVSVSPSGSGVVYPTGSSYLFGSVVQLVAVPNSGYIFQNWTLDGNSAGSSTELTVYMTMSHSVVANFAIGTAASSFVSMIQPGNVVIRQGGTATTAVTVYGIGGFSSNTIVTLSALPSGVTYSSVTLTPNVPSILSITASSTATIGSYYATLTGTSGGTSVSTPFLLTISATAYSTGTTQGTSSTSPINFFFDAVGASALSGTILTVDGIPFSASQLPVTFSWTFTSSHTYSYTNGPVSGGTRIGVTSATGYSGSSSGTVIATQTGFIKANYATQYQLSTSGGNGISMSPVSVTNDGFYGSGSSVQVSTNYAWSTVAGQTRQNLLSYALDGASPVSVSRTGTGTYTTTVTMNAPHTVAFNSGTQYYLTVTGGNGISYSLSSQTSDNWYDSGTSTTVSSNWIWGMVAGQSRSAVSNWQLDTVNQNPSRLGSGTLTTSSVTMSTYHTVAFSSATQYYLTLSGGTSTATLSSQTSDSWFDSGTNAQAQSGYAWSTVAGQSRSNLYSWQVDAGAPTTVSRAASGTFTSSNVLMSTWHTVTFNPVTQYYLTVSGGVGLVYINSQTSDGWYDTGTSIASVTTNTLWSIVAGQSRQNLLSYQVDGGAATTVTRANTGTYSTASITMSTYHTVTFNGQLQYYITTVGGNSVTCASTPFNDCWADSGSTATATSNYVWSVVASQSRLNLASWNLDGGANSVATRAGSGVFTTTSVTMNTFHTINFNSLTQYYVTTTTSISSSGSVTALSTSYSYTQTTTTTVSQALSNPGFETGATTPWSPGGTVTAQTSIVHSGAYAAKIVNSGCVSGCALYGGSVIQTVAAPTGTLTVVTYSTWVFIPTGNPDGISVTLTPGIALAAGCSPAPTTTSTATVGAWTQISVSWSGSCTSNASTDTLRINIGTVAASSTDIFYADDAVLSYTYTTTSTVSGTTSTTINSYSVSGTTATYTYGVGYTFPAGSTATSWSTTWPVAESFSSTACGTASGNTVSGTSSCTGNLVTTRTGTVPTTLGTSPTADGWYDSGVSVTLSASPTGPFTFSSWSASSVNLVLGSTSLASTTVIPNTYGTITASFSVGQ